MSKQIEMPKVTRNKKSSKGRELVYQGNPLIQSRKQFSTIGMRLFILGLMTLNPHLSKNDKFFDEEFPSAHISTNELVKVFENTFYLKDLKAECDKLFNSSLTLDYKNGGFKLMHIFDVLEYLQNDGLYIQFDPKMKPYLLELVEGGYTALNIEQVFKLTSTYAVRLIELCMQRRNMTQGNVITRSLTVEEIRFYLNVPDNAYEGRLDNFRKYVLDEPIAEIARITDFRMSYHVEKEGRRIKQFVFELDISRISAKTFDIKIDDKKLPVSAPYADVLAELVYQGFSRKSAKEILDAVKDNVECGLRLQYALKILAEYNKPTENKLVNKPIKNKLGFLRKAILENWRVNDIKSKNAMNISDRSKEKNNIELNNLDAEKAKVQQRVDNANYAMKATGITSADLQGEESPMPKNLVDMVKDEILKGGELTAGAMHFLNLFKFTPERFKQVYMVKDTQENKNASEGKISGFNSLSNSFSLNF
ncbi:MAG: replication initiation protein [Selenomonadaceae bacterium]|nr:replication initiation protein [Selenomonadaceae bacterium]